MLTGQLVIGWANDALDAPDDAAAGRRDKPIPAGLVPRRAVGVGAVAALAVTAVLSLLLGVTPGLLNLLVVGCGLGYDLALKPRPVSPLPYLVAFGALPAVATTALPGQPWPPAGVMLASGLLGVAAHFANTVPDVEADAATGVRGLPQILGARASLLATALLVSLAAAVLLAALPASGLLPRALLAVGSAVAISVLLSALLAARRGGAPPRASFRLVLVAVALVVAGFLSGS